MRTAHILVGIGLAAVVATACGTTRPTNQPASASEVLSRTAPAPASPRTAPAPSGPTVRDFEILSFEWEPTSRGGSRVKGEILNNGKYPAGAQLQIVARDENDKMVGERSPWVASTRNIAPGDTHPFETSGPDATGAETMTMRVIAVRTW